MAASRKTRHANWLDLFYDLIFVFAVAETTHIIAHPHDGHIAAADYGPVHTDPDTGLVGLDWPYPVLDPLRLQRHRPTTSPSADI